MGDRPKNFSEAIEDLERNPATSELKDRVMEEIQKLEKRIAELKPIVEGEAKKAKENVEKQVRENPWAAIGVVGLIFLVIGILLGGRRSRRDD